MESPENIRISVGDGTVSGALFRPADAFATLVVAPGAGSGFDHPLLVGFTESLHSAGVATLRFNFPYREKGRRLPDRGPKAIAPPDHLVPVVGRIRAATLEWIDDADHSFNVRGAKRTPAAVGAALAPAVAEFLQGRSA